MLQQKLLMQFPNISYGIDLFVFILVVVLRLASATRNDDTDLGCKAIVGLE
jgi:hypothetical protein